MSPTKLLCQASQGPHLPQPTPAHTLEKSWSLKWSVGNCVPKTRSRRPQRPRAISPFFSSISVLILAMFPGFCDLRMLTWLANLLVFARLWSRFNEFTVVETVLFGSPLFQKTEVSVFLHLQVSANLPSSFNLASLATLDLHTRLFM